MKERNDKEYSGKKMEDVRITNRLISFWLLTLHIMKLWISMESNTNTYIQLRNDNPIDIG